MRRLFLVRHALAESPEGYVGWSDPPLGERGVREARLIGERLSKEVSIKAVYSSDLSRSVETAAEVARRAGVRARERKFLREMRFGEWEGKPHEKLVKEDAKRYAAWVSDPERARPPGGETFAELRGRVYRGFEEITNEVDREFGEEVGIAVVAHGGPLRLIACRLLGMPPENHWRLALARSGVTTFEWSARNGTPSLPVLRAFNDLSHLGAGA
ncbi:MAG: histidine phosphatase family protein [Rubrobacteraceae bacterium]